jgi:hypothetical protein
MPQAIALTKTAAAGDTARSNPSMTSAMTNVSSTGERATITRNGTSPDTGSWGPATSGNSQAASAASAIDGTAAAIHPTAMARSGRRGSSSAGNREAWIN